MEKHPLKQIQNGKQAAYYRFIDKKAKKTVVFIHGLFSSSSIFRHFLTLIDHNIILIELRGIVYSKCERPFLENYVEDIRLTLEQEKIEKNVILVGYSLGCAIANRFAEKFSEKVEKVIMLSPINKTLGEIGEGNFAKSLIKGLGEDFFHKWREYMKLENHCPFYKIFSLFNLRLMRDTYQKIDFTEKSEIVILNGTLDPFFDPEDPHFEQANITHYSIDELDHFLFLTRERIHTVATWLVPLLETAKKVLNRGSEPNR